jgi:hypothetical protein
MSNPTYRISSASSPRSGESLGVLEVVTETIHIQHTIQHVLTFRISDKWEKPMRRYIEKFLDLSMYYAESFRFVSVGIGSFFFLWGVSKVVAAGNYRNDDDDDGKGGVSKTSKSKSRSSRKGPSDNATVTTQTSKSTTRRRRRTTQLQGSDADELPHPPTTIAFESIDEIQESEEVKK